MSKFVKTLALFMAGLNLLPSKGSMAQPTPMSPADEDLLKAVSLRPLNGNIDNLFASHASHSSHSSHASHSSHYSGSGGGASIYSAPIVTRPAVVPVQEVAPVTQPVPAPAMLTELPGAPADISLSRAEKLRLQVVRVQIKLHSLGLYDGTISGMFDAATRQGLKLFQKIKSLPETGLMTTDSMNALGIPVVK